MEGTMSQVKISPKYQIVIPKEVREAMGLRPGQKLEVFHFENCIELVPVPKLSELRGRFKGVDTTVKRGDDRF
jgi:AbrB family looped-hinge helix DNA binding protein